MSSSLEAATTAESRTSDRVASSRRERVAPVASVDDIAWFSAGANCRLGDRPDFAHGFAPRVADLPPEEFLEAGWQRFRQRVEKLQQANDRGELRALRSVFHL